jgi:hypothetical protein
LCIVQSLSNEQVAEFRMKTEVQIISTWGGRLLGRNDLEETHEEDYVEADDDDDHHHPSPPTPHAPRRNPLGNCQETWRSTNLRKMLELGKEKSTEPCRVCTAHKKLKDTRYICNTCKVPQHKGDFFTR